MIIAICDDNRDFSSSLKKVLRQHLENDFPSSKILAFHNGNSLINWMKLESVDLDFLFIDVEMPGINGIETLRKLRELGSECVTIVVSSHKQYVFDALDYSIQNYLVKPLNRKKLLALIERLIDQYKSSHATIQLNNYNSGLSLSLGDIIMVSSNLRKLTYHTFSDDFTVAGKMNEVTLQLKPYSFLRTHKSFLINMNHVKGYEGYKFNLEKGLIADISHGKRADIIAEYNRFLANKLLP